MEKRFVRSYAAIPAYEDLSEETRARLRAADQMLRGRKTSLGETFDPKSLPRSSDRAFWTSFEHELSFVFPLPVDADDIKQCIKTSAELSIARGLFEPFQEALAQSDEARFVAFMSSSCSRFNLRPDIRQGDIRTTSDRGGYVQFPPAEMLRTRISEVFNVLYARPGESALFRSLMVMVFVTNAHAYSDGNGRLSRLLFNLNLWHEGVPWGFYFPWVIFFNRSRGGILLRVRQAEIHENWDDLVAQMCEGVERLMGFSDRAVVTP